MVTHHPGLDEVARLERAMSNALLAHWKSTGVKTRVDVVRFHGLALCFFGVTVASRTLNP